MNHHRPLTVPDDNLATLNGRSIWRIICCNLKVALVGMVPAPGFEPGTIWYLRWLTPGHRHAAQGAVYTYSQTLYQVELRRDCEK